MEANTTRVLLVEDKAGDARLIQLMLEESGSSEFRTEVAGRLSTGLERLSGDDFDFLLLDLSLPDSHGLETLREAVSCGRKLPIIVLTGFDDEETAFRALREGAQDYLVKGHTDAKLLARSMRYAAERFRLGVDLELSHQKQLTIRDELLAHVSHELRTPLTAFHQYTALVRDEIAGEINADQRQYLDLAVKSADQLGKMIDQILTVSRAESGKLHLSFRPTSMPELVSAAVSMLQPSAAEKQISLTAEIEDGLPGVCADPSRIRQVLLNLIENGLKYTAAGGHVCAAASLSRTEPNAVEVAIKDDGCGIAAEHLGMIFERHYQAPGPIEGSRKGLGLGLHIARELVVAHGGRMWVESTVAKGSTFRFSIPVFSLTALLASILTAENLEGALPVLFTIQLSRGGVDPDSEALGWAREVVESSVRPGSDLVVPPLPPEEPEHALFVVACTERKGAGSMARRIDGALRAEPRLAAAGWEPEVDYTVAEPDPQVNAHIPALASGIERLISDHSLKRKAHA